MTHFDLENWYEIEREDWTYETLRPPLTFWRVLSDIRFHWFIYTKTIDSFKKRIIFLVLRIFQRLSYNLGWFLSENKLLKQEEERRK